MTINEFALGWPVLSKVFAVLALAAMVDLTGRINRFEELSK